ncbi:MAG: NAD-dependent DNA ligase LigA [Leptospirales bacterium]|nr:NAD-dependent DNA ligase LigA [Leptospirales bacterium]
MATRKSQIARRMRELEDEIRHHQHLYYVKNQAQISDRDFDQLLEELQVLERENPAEVSKDSPTRLVGSDLDSDFPKFQHSIPVLSLANTYSTGEALEWAQRMSEEGAKQFSVQWKIDGATLVLYYEKGALIRAVTRGQGQIGDEVTANALTIRNIPHRLHAKVDLIARGEVYMTYADFETFNEAYGSVYANPRNLAAGSLKHKKSREVARRPLRWLAFEGILAKDTSQLDSERLQRMAELGLPISADNRSAGPAELATVIAEFEAKRDQAPMPVDGLVLKVESIALRDALGATSASPRWATALKFEPEIAETTVLDIQAAVGRTGRVTPRAELSPVKLAGTTVSFATLHNADYIERLGVRIGSRVRVSKRGEIIPAVEEVVDPGKGPAYRFPKKCPACRSRLQRDEDAVDWICPNPLCAGKTLNRIVFFASRKMMDIAGLGERVAAVLFEGGYLQSLADIYRLQARREELEEIEGFGKKSVQLLLDGIAQSKQQPFRRLLPALGLREVGPSVAELLIANGYNSMDRIVQLAAAEDALARLDLIHGIGPRTSEAIIEQFRSPDLLALIEELRRAGLQLEAAATQKGPALPAIFDGQSWCVTGSFERFKPRDLAMDEVRARGGAVVSSVSSRTTHLLAGANAGSKLNKAQELGVQVVSEAEFLKWIGAS